MDKYIDFVCDQAKTMNRIFILDTGEGREIFDKDLDTHIEDLSGWLIPVELKDKVILTRRREKSMGAFDEYYCFATWFYDIELNLKVEFKNYQQYLTI